MVHSTATSDWSDVMGGAFVYKVTAVDFNGNESVPAQATVTVGVDGVTPDRLAFASIVPNPFHNRVTFSIVVPAGVERVDLRVLDLAWRVVRNLAVTSLAPGPHALVWDGRDDSGRRVAAGLYHARLAAAGTTVVRKVAFTP